MNLIPCLRFAFVYVVSTISQTSPGYPTGYQLQIAHYGPFTTITTNSHSVHQLNVNNNKFAFGSPAYSHLRQSESFQNTQLKFVRRNCYTPCVVLCIVLQVRLRLFTAAFLHLLLGCKLPSYLLKSIRPMRMLVDYLWLQTKNTAVSTFNVHFRSSARTTNLAFIDLFEHFPYKSMTVSALSHPTVPAKYNLYPCLWILKSK